VTAFHEKKPGGGPEDLGHAEGTLGTPPSRPTDETIADLGATSKDETLPAAGTPRDDAAESSDFAGYELLGELGRGGMGIVYKARQKELDRLVALKVIIAGEDASEEEISRFMREARASAKMEHPNIVPVHDMGHVGRKHYFTMGFVEGRTLADFVRDEKPNLSQSIATMRKIASAIQYAHERGIIHRDLKPGNVMVDEAGEPHVMDFGLARNVREGSSLTRSGDAVGTPLYMCPEQAEGRVHEVDERADVWSLGVMLYEIIAGQLPFTAGSAMGVLLKVVNDDPLGPRKVSRKAPRDLDTITMKCLEKDRDRRYRTAGALADDLGRFLSGDPIAARPPSLVYRLRKKIAKRKAISAALLVIGVLIAIAASIGLRLYGEKLKERARWGEPVLTDDFERETLGDQWQTYTGVCEIENGRLVATGDFLLLCRERFTGNVAIEFDGMIPDTSKACDLTVWVCAHEERPRREYYAQGVGSDGNLHSSIKISGSNQMKSVVATCPKVIEPGKWYRIRGEREGQYLRLFVDGEKILEYREFFPMATPSHNRAGIYTWFGPSHFDNVRIFRQEGALKVRAVDLGDKLFAARDYEAAAREYADIQRSHPETEDGAEARYKKGLCYVELGRLPEAEQALTGVDHPSVRPYAQYGMVDVLIRRGDFDAALARMNLLRQEYASHELAERIRLDYRRRSNDIASVHMRPDQAVPFMLCFVEELERSDPAGQDAFWRLANLYAHTGQNASAIAMAKEIRSERPGLQSADGLHVSYAMEAWAHTRMGQPDKAMALLALMPDGPRSRALREYTHTTAWLSSASTALGQHEEAMELVDRRAYNSRDGGLAQLICIRRPVTAIQRSEKLLQDEGLAVGVRRDMLFRLPSAYFAVGEFEKALAVAVQLRDYAEKGDLLHLASLRNEALALAALGRLEESLTKLSTAREGYGDRRSPHDLRLRSEFLQVRALMGQARKAEQELLGILEVYRHTLAGYVCLSHIALASFHETRGDDDRALELYLKGDEIAGDYAVSHVCGVYPVGNTAVIRAGLIQLRKGEKQRASETFERLREFTVLNKATICASYLRGEVAERDLLEQIAATWPEEGINKTASLAFAQFVIAEKLASEGKKAEARDWFKEVVDEVPEHKGYDYTMTVRLARRRLKELEE